ncbi:hypothetical protein ACOMHN_060361 [Nucella lapillus]
MCSTRVVRLKYHLNHMHNVEPGSMQELHLLAPTSKLAANKLNQVSIAPLLTVLQSPLPPY